MEALALGAALALVVFVTGASANPVNNGNQAQGQLQGQLQGQVATGGTASAVTGPSTAVTGPSTSTSSSTASSGGNTMVDEAQKRAPVSTAWAAPASVGECGRSVGVGGQVIGFGASFSLPLKAKDRERRCNAVLLDQLGEREAAVLLLSMDRDVNRAVTLARSRRPIEAPPVIAAPPPAPLPVVRIPRG